MVLKSRVLAKAKAISLKAGRQVWVVALPQGWRLTFSVRKGQGAAGQGKLVCRVIGGEVVR